MRIRLVIYGLAFLAITSALVGGFLYHNDIGRSIAQHGHVQANLITCAVPAQLRTLLEN